MDQSFGSKLRQLRIEKNISQQQLADLLFVDRSTVTNWETGRREPDYAMLQRLSKALEVDVSTLLRSTVESGEKPRVILLDDEMIILRGGIPILQEAMPNAEILGFSTPSDAVQYARAHRVSLAFLDIEMGRVSGLDICDQLLAIHPRTNVIYLTAFREYSFDAWGTGACGFILKPLTLEKVYRRLTQLRYPILGLDNGFGGNRQ